MSKTERMMPCLVGYVAILLIFACTVAPALL